MSCTSPLRSRSRTSDAPTQAGHARTGGLSWYLRSVDEILTYLGAVQRREEEGVPYRISVGLDAARTAQPLWSQPDAKPPRFEDGLDAAPMSEINVTPEALYRELARRR